MARSTRRQQRETKFLYDVENPEAARRLENRPPTPPPLAEWQQLALWGEVQDEPLELLQPPEPEPPEPPPV